MATVYNLSLILYFLRWKLHNILSSLVTSFLHKVLAELCQLPLVCSEAELAIVDIDKLCELIVGALAALPEVLAEDVGQVSQVLDPHHPV